MTLRRVLQRLAPFTPFTTNAEALACFAADPSLTAAPVVDHEGRVLGLVVGVPLKMKLADKSGYEMFADQPVTAVMDTAPLVLDAEAPLTQVCDELIRQRPQAFRDGFIVTDHGRYLGFAAGVHVLEEIVVANGEMNERLKLAMTSSRSAIWEIDFDSERLVGGETLERVYKRKLSFDEVRRLGPDFVVPEERENVRRALMEIASGSGQGKLRCRIRRDDGTLRDLRHSVTMFRDSDGQVSRMVVLTSDNTISDRVSAAFGEALNKMEATLAERREMIDKITSRLELAPLRQSETEPEVNLGATYEDVNRNRNRLLAMVDDIVVRDRALMAAVEAVEAASAAKSRFLANMSHELRTPLNAILGYAEILDEDLGAANMNEQAADAQRIRTAARHLLQLINEILDLSKIEAGRMDVSPIVFDVSAMVQDTISTARPLADKNGNRIEVSLADDLGTADTDNVKINQCLLNLLSNACKFTKNGQVRLSGRREPADERLVFEVADSGIGMTEEQVSRLFQPFMQAEASTAREFGGTGLGLAITQRLARLLGGDVTVRSALGEGTTFTLSVPANFAESVRAGDEPMRTADLPAAPAATPQVEAEDDSRPVVIMIDDDAATRDLVRRSLSRLGFTFVDAATGEAGLRAARAHKPALIILDIELPDMSGWSVLETLKHDSAFDEAPVLVFSVDDNRSRAISLGACDLLLKPADREALTAAAVRFARFNRKPAQPASLKIQSVA